MKQIECNTEKRRLLEYYKQLFEKSKKNENLEKMLFVDHLNLIK